MQEAALSQTFDPSRSVLPALMDTGSPEFQAEDNYQPYLQMPTRIKSGTFFMQNRNSTTTTAFSSFRYQQCRPLPGYREVQPH